MARRTAAMFRPENGTRNYDHHHDIQKYRRALERAAGFVRKSDDEQPRYNGGVTANREIRLQKGDKLYRFAGSNKKTLDEQVGGEWWFDEDTCIFLQSKSGGLDSGFRRAARMAFAVIDEWSDMNFCVSGHLAYSFWAIAGNTARAEGKSGASVNPYGIDVRQLFVPGGLKKSDFADIKPVGITRVAY
jgi:hypothetical protein